MAKVFIPNEPMILDEGRWRRSVNVAPARAYGELVFLTPPGQLPEDSASIADAIAAGMKYVTNNDHIVFVGDPRAFAAACATMALRCGGLVRLLLWRGQTRSYAPYEFNVNAPHLHALARMEELLEQGEPT